MSPKLGIHILQKLVIPRNPLHWQRVVDITSWMIASFLSGRRFICPCQISNPRYLTLSQNIWAFYIFLRETLYPLSVRKFRVKMVFLLEASLLRLVIRISSTNWSNVPSINWSSLKSLANTLPNNVGEFLNPWGSTVQQNFCLILKVGSSYSKAKSSYDSGLGGIQKKASFQSNTVNQQNSADKVVSKVLSVGDHWVYVFLLGLWSISPEQTSIC